MPCVWCSPKMFHLLSNNDDVGFPSDPFVPPPPPASPLAGMRLLTCNFFACVVCNSYPLDVTAAELAPAEARYDEAFLRRMLARLDYGILTSHAQQLKLQHPAILSQVELPSSVDAFSETALLSAGANGSSDAGPVSTSSVGGGVSQQQYLTHLHHILVAVAVRNGQLSCPQCHTQYPIKEFIPHMTPPPK